MNCTKSIPMCLIAKIIEAAQNRFQTKKADVIGSLCFLDPRACRI